MNEDCPFCVYNNSQENCPGCFEGSNYRPKPTTNADRIRAMSDEELADYLRWHNDLYSRDGMDWLDWLKQEVDE